MEKKTQLWGCLHSLPSVNHRQMTKITFSYFLLSGDPSAKCFLALIKFSFIKRRTKGQQVLMVLSQSHQAAM